MYVHMFLVPREPGNITAGQSGREASLATLQLFSANEMHAQLTGNLPEHTYKARLECDCTGTLRLEAGFLKGSLHFSLLLPLHVQQLLSGLEQVDLHTHRREGHKAQCHMQWCGVLNLHTACSPLQSHTIHIYVCMYVHKYCMH